MFKMYIFWSRKLITSFAAFDLRAQKSKTNCLIVLVAKQPFVIIVWTGFAI